MKGEGWKMKDKGWSMKVERWRIKVEGGFADEQTDICDCRVAFATEKRTIDKWRIITLKR